ncbi:hypothetical protein [Salarchaeum sp. JOR-1]|uniref:hypothetical protein n=1 Tax=Salarchaeum sp. JOR-1 TaxID=2599399 RepID=UPI0011989041|nr:hypothetical protein [Salarchaeum sp. JOR-1]QDX41291.1 hypothetical protein FQU85_10425 [Salarchaeum sp. JOR-1]
MPSDKATAAAPIATGIALAGAAVREIAQHGLGLWTALALAGGLSAVAVGCGVLTGRGWLSADNDRGGQGNRTPVALVALALTCIAVGAGIALT